MNDNLVKFFASADEATCEAEAIALGQRGQAGLTALKALLAADEADARFWAVRGLWANGSDEAIAWLVEALRDGEEMVRSGAALALGEMQAEVAVEALANLLTGDPSSSGNHAADALSKIGRAATPLLVEALKQAKPWVRVRAAKALGPIEDRASIGPLFHVLEDESYLVRHYAETALERMGVGQMVYFPTA